MGKQKTGTQSTKPRGVTAPLLQQTDREGTKEEPGRLQREKDVAVTPADAACGSCSAPGPGEAAVVLGTLARQLGSPPAVMGYFLTHGIRATF